jgi:hypothetical protein
VRGEDSGNQTYDSSIHGLVEDSCRVHIDDISHDQPWGMWPPVSFIRLVASKSVDECQIPRYYRSRSEGYKENTSNGYGVEDGELLGSSRARLVERKFRRPAKRRTERYQKPKETL